jgi:hypothetical protein
MVLLASLMGGGFFRFENVDWDQSRGYHGDENKIADAAASLRVPGNMDPHLHVYNGLAIYVEKEAALAVAWFLRD